MKSITRRRILKAAALATLTIPGAQDKSGSKRPVMGSGGFTCEVYRDWGVLPSSI